jgi:hypothetical protein
MHRFFVLFILFVFSGCATNYVQKGEGERSVVIFSTDVKWTQVFVSYKKQDCSYSASSYKTVWDSHHVHELPTIFPPVEKKQDVYPLEQPYGVYADVIVGDEARFYIEAATNGFGDFQYGYYETCGIMVGFEPRSGYDYEVNYTARPGYCNVYIEEIDETGRRALAQHEVKTYPSCKSQKEASYKKQ